MIVKINLKMYDESKALDTSTEMLFCGGESGSWEDEFCFFLKMVKSGIKNLAIEIIDAQESGDSIKGKSRHFESYKWDSIFRSPRPKFSDPSKNTKERIKAIFAGERPKGTASAKKASKPRKKASSRASTGKKLKQ